MVLSNTYSFLVFMFLGTVMVFANLLAGWSSNSKYTFIGRLRSVAQSVSYEAVFTTLVLVVFVLSCTYSISSVRASTSVFGVLLLLPIWIFSTLAETHRAPFDFSERESELVSGYNTEYSGAYFAFVFLGEYSALLFSCSLIYHVFCAVDVLYVGPLFLGVFVLLVSFLFIIIRVTYCRFRYDFLIIMAWKSLLPLTLVILLVSYGAL